MFKTYMRLLGFVSPISKYAVPYFFYALLYALFNTLTYAMILPIMNTLFLTLSSSRRTESVPMIFSLVC